MIDTTDRLTGAITIAVVTGAGQDIAVMVGVVVNMKNVTGNDDDCGASARDADVKGGAGDERSEAAGRWGRCRRRRRAVWVREVGAKRVLGDVGRGGGSVPRASAANRME